MHSPTALAITLLLAAPAALSAPAQADTYTWQNITVLSTAENQEKAMQLIHRLSPFVNGEIKWADSAKAPQKTTAESTKIELKVWDRPTAAYCRNGTVYLLINAETAKSSLDSVYDKLEMALSACIQHGKLAPIEQASLWENLVETFRRDTIDWQHIVLIGSNDEQIRQMLQNMAPHAKIEYRRKNKDHIANYRELGDNYVEIDLHYGYKWETDKVQVYHFGATGTLPRIELTYVPRYAPDTPEEQKPKIAQRKKKEAIEQFFEMLQPLLINGKLPPIKVKDLQRHFETYRADKH